MYFMMIFAGLFFYFGFLFVIIARLNIHSIVDINWGFGFLKK